MIAFRLILAGLAVVYVLTRFLGERKRLKDMQAMPIQKALDHYERERTRADRIMWIVAGVFICAAVGLSAYAVVFGPGGTKGS